jgi:8-oxo-dGTP pyrophosphatase MutT (NUDIX family)/catechol 2,3-dioxygenase-like lactoylglutathione lyase family enzyme
MTDPPDLDVDPVRAAGGVVWRRGPSGIEVVVIHRARYDDWSLPKGKVDPGEDDEQAARREVQEESSVIGLLGPELRSTTYVDRNGRNKRVRYWAMTVAGGNVGPDNEVDVAEWLPIDEARRRLSYDRDRPVLDSAAAALAPAGELTVIDLDHVVINTADVEASLGWWCGVLGLAPVRVDEWRAGRAPFPSVRINDGTIIDLLAVQPSGSNMDHLCVVVNGADLDRLATSGIFEVLEGPGPRYGARGEGVALYVRAPEGTTVELRTYAPEPVHRLGDGSGSAGHGHGDLPPAAERGGI